MLSEFALTPSVFDEASHDDLDQWIDELRELGAGMFPRNGPWPVVVSDLYDGGWMAHVEPYVKSIENPRARHYCQSLLVQIKEALVRRPICGDWPQDCDATWCREAIASSRLLPIDRIVSTTATRSSSPDEFRTVRALSEARGNGFWRGIGTDARPRMVFDEQVALIRTLAAHADWLAIINPYGCSTEGDFTVAILQLIAHQNQKLSDIDVEVHAQSPDTDDTTDRDAREQRLVKSICGKFDLGRHSNVSVRFHFWPKFLERFIIAGTYTSDARNTRRMKPRWGIKLGHVARRESLNQNESTDRSLLSRQGVGEWFDRFISEKNTSKPSPMSQ